MIKAIDKFNKLEEGVLGIINAADIYAVHIMAKIRNTEPEKELIKPILTGGKMTVFNVYGGAYKEEELQLLEKEGHFSGIGQQIIVATHTALESYLIWKFKEYYRYMCSNTTRPLVEETLKRFNFRCLNDFKITYKTFFDIH